MRVRTFFLEDPSVEGVLLKTGNSPLCVVKLDNGRIVARHPARVEPLDDEARAALKAVKVQ